MERKSILTSQKEVVKNSLRDGFKYSGVDTVNYLGNISAETYCALIEVDYRTVSKLGNITYSISYLKENELYLLLCETFVDLDKNDKLSVILEDTEDWLGLFKTEGKAQELPSNWKELITDEQLHDILQERNIQTIECLNDDDVPDEMKERIAKDWCESHSDELEDYLDATDKMTIAYNYIEENPSDSGSEVVKYISDDDAKDLIKDLVDNL